jgi:TRAP-type C4-dicarboxylate transport system permease small subunit
MMKFARIVYWLLSIVAASLLILTAAYLVEIAYSQGAPDWWLHALSLALLAICIWFVGWVFRYVVRKKALPRSSAP